LADPDQLGDRNAVASDGDLLALLDLRSRAERVVLASCTLAVFIG
jgi:hypothetical protein